MPILASYTFTIVCLTFHSLEICKFPNDYDYLQKGYIANVGQTVFKNIITRMGISLYIGNKNPN